MMIRAFFISLTALTLSACGFTPVHQSVSGSGSQLQDIEVTAIKTNDIAENQAGFIMTQRLRDRMGNGGAAPQYRLEITPDYSRRRIGITDDDVASRYDITVRAKYRLIDTKSGSAVHRGNISSINSFGATTGPFGVITADSVGIEQASQETADRVIRDLALYFSREKDNGKG